MRPCTRPRTAPAIDFNRPPRLLPPARRTRFALPAPPDKPDRRPWPILMAVAPILLGVGMWYLTKAIYMLAMCAMSPVMVVGNYVSDRKRGRSTNARRAAEYAERKARVEQDAQLALEAERKQRRDDCPDPAAVLSIASGPRRRLMGATAQRPRLPAAAGGHCGHAVRGRAE